MGALNGIAGAVNGVNTVRTWDIATSADIQKLIASNTKGGPARLIGNEDWRGSYKAYGHTPILLPGYAGAFLGSFDGANGVSGDIVVDRATINIPIEAGGPIEHTVDFSGNGALDFGAAVVEDETDPEIYTSIGCKVMLGTVANPAVWTKEVDNVRAVSLVLNADNVKYVSSGTGGKTKRLPGNIDASLSISVYEGDPTEIIVPNTLWGVRLYVNATEYWELLWALFSEASGVEVDRESAAMIGATLNAAFNGYTKIQTVETEGHILDPASEAWWPTA